MVLQGTIPPLLFFVRICTEGLYVELMSAIWVLQELMSVCCWNQNQGPDQHQHVADKLLLVCSRLHADKYLHCTLHSWQL